MRFTESRESRMKCKLNFYARTLHFPHIDHRVSRRIIPFKRKQEHDNFLRKLRYFSDDFYPWGEEKRHAVSDSSA